MNTIHITRDNKIDFKLTARQYTFKGLESFVDWFESASNSKYFTDV